MEIRLKLFVNEVYYTNSLMYNFTSKQHAA